MQRALLLALLLASSASANDPDRAIALIQDLDGLRAEFRQEVRDEVGLPIEESTGRFALQAPNLFRWHYLTPYEQLIVADGERVWLYDVDLEQVTVRDQQAAAASSPLHVLTEPETLDERFVVDYAEAGEGNTLINLSPRMPDSDFERIGLLFEGEALRELIIDDKFGQRTAILFAGIEINPEASPEAFRFTPPEDVDVLGLEELLEGMPGDDSGP
ncbi:MAG: outer membrane lipoprotein chaperone LolA [Pseudomonadota bacterium]